MDKEQIDELVMLMEQCGEGPFSCERKHDDPGCDSIGYIDQGAPGMSNEIAMAFTDDDHRYRRLIVGALNALPSLIASTRREAKLEAALKAMVSQIEQSGNETGTECDNARQLLSPTTDTNERK